MRPEHWLHTLPLRLRSLFHRNQVEQDLSEELQYHLEQKTKEYTASGMAPEEARRKARREFGGIEQTKEICRDTRRVSLLETLSQDVRFGLRMLRKSPGFTAVAVLTLALGIGATTAVFSLVSAILLKPLPFPNPDQIVLPELVSPPGVNLGSDYFPWSQTQFRFLAQDSHPFHAVAAFQNDSFNLTGTDVPSFLDGFRVSAEFFPALGISPALGRGFTAEEDRPGHEYEVVLSDRMWREYFGANRAILGKAVPSTVTPTRWSA